MLRGRKAARHVALGQLPGRDGDNAGIKPVLAGLCGEKGGAVPPKHRLGLSQPVHAGREVVPVVELFGGGNVRAWGHDDEIGGGIAGGV